MAQAVRFDSDWKPEPGRWLAREPKRAQSTEAAPVAARAGHERGEGRYVRRTARRPGDRYVGGPAAGPTSTVMRRSSSAPGSSHSPECTSDT